MVWIIIQRLKICAQNPNLQNMNMEGKKWNYFLVHGESLKWSCGIRNLSIWRSRDTSGLNQIGREIFNYLCTGEIDAGRSGRGELPLCWDRQFTAKVRSWNSFRRIQYHWRRRDILHIESGAGVMDGWAIQGCLSALRSGVERVEKVS